MASKRIFKECYARLGESLFCFSSGWFSGFLSRHHISLRFTTNKAQKIPDDYQQLVVNWFQFNRRNSQLRPEDLQARPHVFLEVVLARDVGRYYLSNICNLDETPLPFEYLEGRTYSIKGLKTIWAKTIRSGWDKRQATLILCIFADGISRIRPVIIFHGKGSSRMDAERKLYDKRVMVEFNPTAALGGRPSLFAFDCVEFHKTSAVRRKLLENDVIPSVVPPGCTGLVQPLDISVNKPLKSLMQDFTDEAIEQRGEEHDKWTVGEMRVLTTHCVASAWDDLCKNKRQVVVDSFRHVGLSLPVDGSRDSELCVKGFAPGTLEVGDWRAWVAMEMNQRR